MVSYMCIEYFHVSSFLHFSVSDLDAVTINNLFVAHKANYMKSAPDSYQSFTVHKMNYYRSSFLAWL
jgi:hypothetical protein